MPKLRPDPIEEAEMALGEPGEEEFTFLLVPVATYALVSEVAKKQSCSVGEVFQKALLQYVRSVEGGGQAHRDAPPQPEPHIVVRKRRP